MLTEETHPSEKQQAPLLHSQLACACLSQGDPSQQEHHVETSNVFMQKDHLQAGQASSPVIYLAKTAE